MSRASVPTVKVELLRGPADGATLKIPFFVRRVRYDGRRYYWYSVPDWRCAVYEREKRESRMTFVEWR